MADNFDNNDPLEELLDETGEDQFGSPRFKDHAESDAPLVLKNWSAKDFSDIYVRFYPFVLRHAKRYLTNHSQAEEVTQDAFLYLMTSLPEVDSETGVLKLLKWKTRLIALDVIAANSKSQFAPLDESSQVTSDDDEIDDRLLRADEAAIVSLALAKLQPRQREALIATVYEEKRLAEVAVQLGVNENAAKQLVYRAKSAFRRALVGEAQTAGMTVSQVLSVAARKASKDAGKYVAVASSFLLAIAVGFGVIANTANSSTDFVAQPVEGVPSAIATESVPGIVATEEANPSEQPATAASVEDQAPVAGTEPEDETSTLTVASEPKAPAASGETVESETAQSAVDRYDDFQNIAFARALSTQTEQAFFYTDSRPDIYEPFDGESVQIFAGTGISAFLDYRTDELRLANTILQLNLDGERVYGVPRSVKSSTYFDGTDYIMQVIGEGIYIVDEGGIVHPSTPMRNAQFIAEVRLDSNFGVTGTSLVVQLK